MVTEVGGFEDGGFKVGVEPAERESGAAGSHWGKIKRWRLSKTVEVK